jgi:UDP-N-acetylglucosamine 2-epimerase (non-hydrolysing)
MNESRIAVVFGTRPEIVKLAPVIKALEKPPILVHTGQHYDDRMAGVFLDAFGLPEPSHTLTVGGETRGQQIGMATIGLDHLFEEITPTAVVAQGDTNSTLAAALAANARSIPIAHVEAGLRSFDRAMPEEHNRVVTDHLSDLCLAPTATSQANLSEEGIHDVRVVVTGNTVVDAVHHLLPGTDERALILREYGLERESFVVSTFHRPENVDHPDRLETIIRELASLDMPVLLPLHPRTRAIADRHGIELEPGEIHVTEPLGYIEFLGLLAECALAVADSGGLQEEVSVVKKPMVVVRNSTERPEVLGTFCTLVQVGEDISRAGRGWLSGRPHTLDELSRIPSPYGDGHAAGLCASAIQQLTIEAS